MQYYLFIFLDVAIMHYLHEGKMKKDKIISKDVQIYLFIHCIWHIQKTPSLSTECLFLSYPKAFTSCMVYYFFASSIVTRSISILICAFISSFSATCLAFSTSFLAFSAFKAVISSCITYTEEIGPPL